MKKLKLFLLSLPMITSFVVHADLPAGWIDQARALSAAASGLKATLDGDVVLYDTAINRVKASISTMEENHKLREETFACVTTQFNGLVASLDKCQSDTAKIIANGTRDVASLEAELLALKTETTNQIQSLVTEKLRLIALHNEWSERYESDLGEYAEEGKAIMESLNALSKSFHNVISKRKSMVSDIDGLLEKLNLEVKEELADISDIRADICDKTHSETGIYTPIETNPIECPVENDFIGA